MKRFIVIGDIHGCLAEFKDLLAKVGPGPEDEIIALGDLVNRGPESLAVWNWFSAKKNFHALLGNHEYEHIHWADKRMPVSLSTRLLIQQCAKHTYDSMVNSFRTLPVMLELPWAILCHGFWEPYVPLASQQTEVLVAAQGVEARLRKSWPKPWYTYYDNEKPLIVGHHDYSRRGVPFTSHDRVLGIDTGCCYGRALTALLLPDFLFVSVSSRKKYWPVKKK